MKQTEIGLIPDDWKEHTLRDLIDILTDYTANGSFESLARNVRYLEYPSYARLIRLTDIRTNFTNEGVYVSKYSYDFLKKSSLHGGELLLANVGAYAGFSFIYPENLMFRGTLGPNMFLIKFFNQKIDNTFAYYAFSHGTVYDQLISKAASSAQPKLNKEDVRTCYINIPSSIQEQQRIAKALSDVDAVISTTEKLIQKKKNIKQGTMQELLTGKKRLPGFAKSNNTKMTELGEIPEDWEVKSLGDIFSIKHGYGFEGQFFSSENNQHIVVTPGNFKLEGGFQKQKQPIYYTGTYPDEFKLKPNNLIIMMTDLSKNSDTLGNPAIVPDDGNYYLHNQRIGLIQIHNDSFVKDYIYLLLCTKEYHESVVATAAGSTVKHTSPNRIYSINLVVSTSKEEQTAIANVLSSMDKGIETLNTKLEKYRNLKTAMMQQLLTGKIRLV